jgi:hypothetical protein
MVLPFCKITIFNFNLLPHLVFLGAFPALHYIFIVAKEATIKDAVAIWAKKVFNCSIGV